MKQVNKLKVCALAAFLAASAPFGVSQAIFGSIFGTVVDSTGAAIPGATVVVTDSAKGTTSTVTTNASGEFSADHLIPDPYTVKITASGFKTFATQNIAVSADTSRKVEASMEIGAQDQTVEVSADAVPQLKVDRADVSTSFSAREIQDLPIGDRNFTNFAASAAGCAAAWLEPRGERESAGLEADSGGRAGVRRCGVRAGRNR